MDPYKVLGISPNATDEEIKNAYRNLARKYHPDNYAADNPLAELATEKMQEINAAYDMIQKMRAGQSAGTGQGSSYQNKQGYAGGTGIYAEIRLLINSGRFGEADRKLSAIPEHERTADWHFLTAVILRRRGWASDAMRELEIACQMDPHNPEYQKAKQMFNDQSNAFGRTYYGDRQNQSAGCTDCDLCTSLLCLNCLCSGCR